MANKIVRQLIDITAGTMAADARVAVVPERIEILQTGEWDTPWHGYFRIGKADLEEYIRNFENEVRKDKRLPIDLEHNTVGGAAAWIVGLSIEENEQGGLSLWGDIEWTKRGKQLVQDKEYVFFSPEFATVYEDPEQIGVFYTNVLIGGGLTNRPLFKNLTTVAAKDNNNDDSNGQFDNIIYLSEENRMHKLETILKKAADTLEEAEIKVLKANADKLTDEQKETFKSVLADDGGDDSGNDDGQNDDGANDDNNDGGDADAGDAGDAGDGDDDGGEGDSSTQANEGTVSIKASDLEQLKADAAAGRAANDKLEARAASDHIESLAFNEDKPKFSPVMASSIKEFYTGLNEKQRKAFDSLVEEMPSVALAGEIGGSKVASTGSAYEEMKDRADALIKEASDKGQTLTLPKAMKKVRAADSDLAKRYDKEVKGGV